jgi:threonine/homoserine/homoserine lactone efflux protein
MDSQSVALYLKAAGYGIAVAAPVGPMSVLCMRRSLTQGWRYGLATGAGIAIADGAYALVAALGLAGVTRFMLAHERPLHLAAGFFLLYLGVKALFSKTTGRTTETASMATWPAALGSATLLTLTNPPTIIMFAAILATLAPRSGLTPATALLTVAGVVTGSFLWWCGLVAVISGFRHMIGATLRRWIDCVAGVVLGSLGVAEVRKAIS